MSKIISFLKDLWAAKDLSRTIVVTRPEEAILFVKSFKDGIVTLIPEPGCDITDLAENVENCFSAESDFRLKLNKAFKRKKNTKFTGINFIHNGVSIAVTEENADKDKILAEWWLKMEKLQDYYNRSTQC
jgi:hypothetical protein